MPDSPWRHHRQTEVWPRDDSLPPPKEQVRGPRTGSPRIPTSLYKRQRFSRKRPEGFIWEAEQEAGRGVAARTGGEPTLTAGKFSRHKNVTSVVNGDKVGSNVAAADQANIQNVPHTHTHSHTQLFSGSNKSKLTCHTHTAD